ncbi:MAG: hypothetical protein CMF89_02425 [Candidatus Marinimicrobia bacterium]|jgi:hypothetical protein|nr:hypothetical protein [Candidatus Neomarinimicrobiota bacterium]
MSLKSFHIIFISASSLFMTYFIYWSLDSWFSYKDLSYLFYSVLSLGLLISLIIYSRNFSKKYKELTS